MEIDKEKILKNVTDAIKKAKTIDEIENLRIKYLGKKGEIITAIQQIGNLPKEEKPIAGKILNELKNTINQLINERKNELQKESIEKSTQRTVDLTLPNKFFLYGRSHPLQQVLNKIIEIFVGFGFDVVEGPEIETEHYNFDALNTPAGHPARTSGDTFYLLDGFLLRTQTSSVQPRIMEKTKPPVQIIAPGRCYRRDAIDSTHSPVFHQVEGLMIDEYITFANLKAILFNFAKEMFGDVEFRFRPDYFPFTEPSAEASISCVLCSGKGCSVCSFTGWLEILGCGLVHPNVLKNVGYDVEKYNGLAFGMGIERIAMIKFGIGDMRLFFENDLRFLKQF